MLACYTFEGDRGLYIVVVRPHIMNILSIGYDCDDYGDHHDDSEPDGKDTDEEGNEGDEQEDRPAKRRRL